MPFSIWYVNKVTGTQILSSHTTLTFDLLDQKSLPDLKVIVVQNVVILGKVQSFLTYPVEKQLHRQSDG